MDYTSYILNKQKLLFLVTELHKRGFEKLHIVPSLSGSGAWRCSFISEDKVKICVASLWIYTYEEDNPLTEIKLTYQELADKFERENLDFLEHCKGTNKEYTEWYSKMVQTLKTDELPYAFSDYFSPADFWQTSLGNEIKTLPNEKEYYYNY